MEPLDIERDAADLFAANSSTENWAYLPYGPYETVADYVDHLRGAFGGDDPMSHAVLVGGKAVGIASFMRINPGAGSIEVGHINYSPLLQRTIAATEAMHLMMMRAFDLGYRRYEWKCNAANGPFAGGGFALGISVRECLAQASHYERLQSGYRVVLHSRQRVAEGPRGARSVVVAGEF